MNPLCLNCLVEFHQSGSNKWAGFWHQGLTPFKKQEFLRGHFRGCPAVQVYQHRRKLMTSFPQNFSTSFICAGAPFLWGGYTKGRVRFSLQAYLKGKSQKQVPAADFGYAVSTTCHASSILQRRFCRHMWGNKREWIKAYSVNEQDSGLNDFSSQKLQEETFLMLFCSFLPTDHIHLGLAQ